MIAPYNPDELPRSVDELMKIPFGYRDALQLDALDTTEKHQLWLQTESYLCHKRILLDLNGAYKEWTKEKVRRWRAEVIAAALKRRDAS
jgi:hypothetical protein